MVGRERSSAAEAPPAAFIGPLAAAIFMTALDTRAVAPLLPAIAEDLDASVASTGLMVTAYGLPFALSQLVYGPLGDRLGRLRIITFSYGGFVVGTLLTSLAPSLPMLLLVRAFSGVLAGGVFPLALAHVGDTVPYARRQAAIGVLFSTSAAAQVLSVSIGGMAGELFNWRVLYAGLFVIGGVSWLAFVAAVRRSPPPPRPAVDETGGSLFERFIGPYVRAYKVPGAARLFTLVFFETLLVSGGFSYVGASVHDRFGTSLFTVGLMLSGYGVGAFGAARVVGRLVSRLGERRMVLLGGILMTAGYAAVALSPWPETTFAAVFLMGCGFACSHSTLQTIVTEIAPRYRGTSLSMHAFNGLMGVAIGAAIFGGLLGIFGGYELLLGLWASLVLVWTVAGTTFLPAPVRSSGSV